MASLPRKVEETDAVTIRSKGEDPETNEATGVGQTGNTATVNHASTGPKEMIERADSAKLSDDHNNN